MTQPTPDQAPRPFSDALVIAQAEIRKLEPYIESVPMEVIATSAPYPLSPSFAQHLGGEGMATFNAAYSKLSENLSREELIELSRRAVDERGSDEIDQLPERARKQRIFAEGFMLSTLTRDERTAVLGTD